MPYLQDHHSRECWYAQQAELSVLAVGAAHLEVRVHQLPWGSKALLEKARKSDIPQVGWWCSFWKSGRHKR
jgi:hypothetical protein